MKRVTLIPKHRALFELKRTTNQDTLCYYLDDDYLFVWELQNKFLNKIKIKSLAGLFDATFQEIKNPFLELATELNKRYDSRLWWSTSVASRNNASTPLLHNITYLFCVKKIISDLSEDVIFIVNSHALSDFILVAAQEAGYQVLDYRNIVNDFFGIIRREIYHVAQAAYYIWQILQHRRAAFKLLKPLPARKAGKKKRIVIRSWVTNGSFDKSGKFKDRNFGSLPTWLRSRGYEVWILPMFFNLFMKTSQIYSLLKNQEQQFLIPHHYLKFRDYLWACYEGYKMLRMQVKDAMIRGIDIASLYNEAIRQYLIIPDLCYPMLRRLREAEFEIDGFYYAFEGNPPEKQFILGSRKYFPNSKIIGFQHTVFFPNQLAHHLNYGESDYHPLPDKIVCSGPIYIALHKKAGFPSKILVGGPNLRYAAVYMDRVNSRDNLATTQEKMLLLPLASSHALAFDLLVKVKNTLKDLNDYKVCIRSHPLLSKKILIDFLNKINLDNYKFADEGIIQEWLSKTYSVISAGASITILEAVSMGIPIIRVVPDNTFFYDPFLWPDYPLVPVNTASEIRDQLHFIDEIIYNDKEIFKKIGGQVLKMYFTKPTEENMRLFL